MSIIQKIRDDEKRQKKEAEEKKRKIEELIRTHPIRSKSSRLIPIIYPILRELANETNLLIQKKEDVRDTTGGYRHIVTSSLMRYEFWTKSNYGRKWLLFPTPGGYVFDVKVGNVSVDSYNLEVYNSAISIAGRRAYQHQQDISESYNFDVIPERDNQIREWFTDVLFSVYRNLKSMGTLS